MPPREKFRSRIAHTAVVQAWLDGADNLCLRQTVEEALLARLSAEEHGARDRARSRRALDAADATLDSVIDGRVTGDKARKRAAVAVRKYEAAYACLHGRGGSVARHCAA